MSTGSWSNNGSWNTGKQSIGKQQESAIVD